MTSFAPPKSPRQELVVDMMTAAETRHRAAASAAFVASLQADGRKCTDMPKRDYDKHKANMMRSFLGLGPR